MYKPEGMVACFLIILLISTSGCSFLSTAPKPAIQQGTAGDHALIETPTLPDQYTARGPQAGSRNPAQPVVVTTKGPKPVLRSAALTRINGTGLGNSTNSTFTQYIINQSQMANATLLQSTTEYWNKQSKIIAEKMDSQNPVTHDFALKSIKPIHSGTFNIGQACDIWDSVTPLWTYVNDPVGHEYNNYASESINLGLKGDCDDHAILNAALIDSIGGNSRVILATAKTGDSGHAYAEVQINEPSYEDSIKTRYSKSTVYSHTGNWISMDWFDSYPGGKFFEDNGVITAVYKSGVWEMYAVTGTNTTLILKGY